MNLAATGKSAAVRAAAKRYGYPIIDLSTSGTAVKKEATWGFLFRPKSLWIGAHMAHNNTRLCINVVPMFTIWIGKAPDLTKV